MNNIYAVINYTSFLNIYLFSKLSEIWFSCPSSYLDKYFTLFYLEKYFTLRQF